MEELPHIQKLGKDMKSGYKIEWTDEASTNLDLIIDYFLRDKFRPYCDTFAFRYQKEFKIFKNIRYWEVHKRF